VEIYELPARELARSFRDRGVSSAEAVQSALDRIDAVERLTNSFVGRDRACADCLAQLANR
jgi:Asp-tRNA(Asn)/Glu-tRNA(Gln) amidotransferase A subunit family amidase